MRRLGERIRTGKRYQHRRGAYAIALIGDGVLLTVKHAEMPELQLPGGGIDAGESPLQALHREVMEETGWRIADARHIGAYRRFTYMPDYDQWAEKVCTVYLARAIRPLGEPTEMDHTAMVVPLGLAASLVTPAGDREWLRRMALKIGRR